MYKDPICKECRKEPRYLKHSRCQVCFNKHRMGKRDVEKTNAQNRASLARNKETRRRYLYRLNYNITDIIYNEILESQGFACAICRTPESELKLKLSVDHDHLCCPGRTSCGKCIRGLLCNICNLSLGGFKDSEEMLKAALKYLTYHREVDLD